MTLPDERYRAVMAAEQLLKDLLTPGNRVPRAYKDRARWLLRHYPDAWHMDRAAYGAPLVFASDRKLDPLQVFIIDAVPGIVDQ